LSEQVDAVVVGAGAVGLAIGRALALRGREALVLESEPRFGSHTSSRNSEVIHAGLYYAPGSLKARLCVSGKQMLYRYCAEHAVPHRNCGKLIVAARHEDEEKLTAIRARGEQCGVVDLRLLSRAEACRLEPALEAHAALLSPSTGIVDSHLLMQAFIADIERCGGSVVYRSPVGGVRIDGEGFEIDVLTDPPVRLHSRSFVNAAGLWASDVARAIRGLDPESIPATHYAKGHYFTLTTRCPFSRLIYPVPEPHGLGIHLTLDLAGQARFGPDVMWIEEIDYRFQAQNASHFYDSIRRYWPALPDSALASGYTGIRPKLTDANGGTMDFRIDTERAHGVRGLTNLYGIESPGLTAALAIAEIVADSLCAV
jgi:L-2-hydroxyglutarate oxidase LhgO